MEFKEITDSINQAFISLDSFMSGKLRQYNYFGFNDAFENLIVEFKKPANYTPENSDLMNVYYTLTKQVNEDFWDVQNLKDADLGKYIDENDSFTDDRWELEHIWWSKLDRFCKLINLNEIASITNHRLSYTCILKTDTLQVQLIKIFPEYLSHEKHETLAEAIKSKFRDQKGKTIRLMIEALKDKNLLNIIDGHHSELFRAIDNFFDWNIGSYNSIFQTYDFKPGNSKCKKDFEIVLHIIENLLIQIEIDKNDTKRL